MSDHKLCELVNVLYNIASYNSHDNLMMTVEEMKIEAKKKMSACIIKFIKDGFREDEENGYIKRFNDKTIVHKQSFKSYKNRIN